MVVRRTHFDHDAGLKSYRLGTHRTLAPEETLARVEPHLRTMGITRVANVTGLDDIGIPVVMVVRPNSRSISVSQGKGIELAAAKASGVKGTSVISTSFSARHRSISVIIQFESPL